MHVSLLGILDYRLFLDLFSSIHRANGGTVKTTVSIEEPTNLVEFLLSPESKGITGRFIHSRDDYKSAGFFDDTNQYKLRRKE